MFLELAVQEEKQNDEDDIDDDKCYRLSLLTVSNTGRLNRTKPIIAFLEKEAIKNKVHVNELLGVVLKQLNYHSDKRSSITPIANTLIQNEKELSENIITMPKICYLQQNLQLGRFNYNILKKMLLENFTTSFNSVKLPSWSALRAYQRKLTSAVLRDTHLTGVRFSYISALTITIREILECSSIVPSSNLTVHIKDGVDGSGGHAIYHQVNNIDTRNIIMFMFSVLRITDNETNQAIFEEPMASSPFAMRPLFLVLGKEVLGNLQDISDAILERSSIAHFEVITSKSTHTINIKASFSMIDSKMRALVTGLGGAYCLLCTVPQSVACGMADGFLPV